MSAVQSHRGGNVCLPSDMPSFALNLQKCRCSADECAKSFQDRVATHLMKVLSACLTLAQCNLTVGHWSIRQRTYTADPATRAFAPAAMICTQHTEVSREQDESMQQCCQCCCEWALLLMHASSQQFVQTCARWQSSRRLKGTKCSLTHIAKQSYQAWHCWLMDCTLCAPVPVSLPFCKARPFLPGQCSETHLCSVLGGDATINLDPGVDAVLVAHLPQLLDLLHLALDEALASKAGVHCRRAACHGTDRACRCSQSACGGTLCTENKAVSGS